MATMHALEDLVQHSMSGGGDMLAKRKLELTDLEVQIINSRSRPCHMPRGGMLPRKADVWPAYLEARGVREPVLLPHVGQVWRISQERPMSRIATAVTGEDLERRALGGDMTIARITAALMEVSVQERRVSSMVSSVL
jgi:hypothetical protein